MTGFSQLCRRSLLIAFLVAALAGCASDPQAGWQGPFFFIQMADPQFGMFSGDKDVEKETALFTQAIDHANRLRPAFVVICGDLVNKPGDPGQVTAFLRVAGRLDRGIPLYLVSGNHDVENTPTPASLERYRQRFGPDWYAFHHGGCRFVVINTTLIHDPSKATEQMQQQEAWLKNELTDPGQPRPVHRIVFQHHPWFIQTADEPDVYENIPLSRRSQYLEWLTQANVSAVFCGHRHGNSTARHGRMEIVSTGPIGKPLRKDPSGLRIVEVCRDRLVHRYYPVDAVPEKVCLAGGK